MACPKPSPVTRPWREAGTSSTARSPTRPSPKRTTSTTRRSRTSCRCRRSDRLRALGLRLLLLLGEQLHDEPRHSRGERDDHHDEDEEPDQAEDGVHDELRIAPCPAHASSCWMRSARESFPTPPSTATKDRTRSATPPGRSAAWTCPTSRRSGSGTWSRLKGARRSPGLPPWPAGSSSARKARTRRRATGS